MKELLAKLSSYNIFNYLVPGAVFAALGERITSYNLVHEDIVVGLFQYYFAGLVISRIGSLVVEPVLKRLRFVTFATYEEYVRVSAIDSKLEELSESNNMYRTFCALFVVLLVLVLSEPLAYHFPSVVRFMRHVLLGSLLVLFLFSYRKQTGYITARIRARGK